MRRGSDESPRCIMSCDIEGAIEAKEERGGASYDLSEVKYRSDIDQLGIWSTMMTLIVLKVIFLLMQRAVLRRAKTIADEYRQLEKARRKSIGLRGFVKSLARANTFAKESRKRVASMDEVEGDAVEFSIMSESGFSTIREGLREITGGQSGFFLSWTAFVIINFQNGRRALAYGQ